MTKAAANERISFEFAAGVVERVNVEEEAVGFLEGEEDFVFFEDDDAQFSLDAHFGDSSGARSFHDLDFLDLGEACEGMADALEIFPNILRQGAHGGIRSPAEVARLAGFVEAFSEFEEVSKVIFVRERSLLHVPYISDGVDFADEVGTGCATPNFVKRGRDASGGGRVESVYEFVVVGGDKAAGRGYCIVRICSGSGDAVVDLALGGGAELVVVDAEPTQVSQDVGAGHDGLGLHGCCWGFGADFVGDDATQVGFECDEIDETVVAVGIGLELEGSGEG